MTLAKTKQFGVGNPDPATAPVEPTIYDYNGLGIAYEATMSLWSQDVSSIPAIGLEFREYEGFNMDAPEDGADDMLYFQYSIDGGTTWQTEPGCMRRTRQGSRRCCRSHLGTIVGRIFFAVS